MSSAITVRADENVKKRVNFELTTKQQANAAYLAKLDESIAQAERGEVVMYTKEQMRALEKSL
jgi:predicted transcriptional regulator